VAFLHFKMAEEKKDISYEDQDILKEFQLAQLTVSEKSSPDFGLKMSRKIWSYVQLGFGGYFYNRNARFIDNRNYANGTINVQQMFQDFLELNGKQNYIRLSWQTLLIVNTIISRLVARWMQKGEKVQVTAIDSLSVKDKKEQYEQFEFIIENRKHLEELQEQSGVQIIPTGEDIPSDKEELNLWQAQFQRVPEEILTELGCNDVLASCGWYDVLKELMLHDSAETGFVGTYTYMDKQGVIHVDRIFPENSIYSYSKYPDFRDTSWRGDAPTIKISELRKQYGKEFNPDNPLALTEKQLWTIAQQSKEYSNYTNLLWNDVWVTGFFRPYDEWNVRAMRFELKTVDKEPYTVTTSKSTGTTYAQKGVPTTKSGKVREMPSDNQKVYSDTNWNIYEGVFLPDHDMVIKWGIKKNMIRPQDPREIGNAEFSYTFHMPQNYEMRNLAIPEKIKAAVNGMILSLLRMQQLMARAIPPGWMIDESVLQTVDYGLGNDGNKSVDHSAYFFQTGLLYYHGIDADGNRIEPPIKELANTGFAPQMQAYIQNYQFNYQTLKDELGEDPNLISAALQPRVTAGNVEASQKQGDYATDSYYNAYVSCMRDTSRKITCLLKDSVTYGSKAYRDVINQDIGDRIFSTNIQFLPTQQQVADFDVLLSQTMNTSPDIVLFIDPFQLRRIAKEDVKLAETLFRRGQKKMLLWQKQTAAENQQATGDIQIKSAQAAEQAKQQTEQIKGEIDLQKAKMEGEATNKNAIVAMVTSMLSKGEQIPANLQPVVNVVMENIIIPLAAQNEEQKQAVIQQYQQAQQGQEQQEGEQPQEQQMEGMQGEQQEMQQQNQQPQQVAA